jgi:hypothetical protein
VGKLEANLFKDTSCLPWHAIALAKVAVSYLLSPIFFSFSSAFFFEKTVDAGFY